MKVQFYLRFHTSFGQTLWISDDGELGTDMIEDAIPMTYLNEDYWEASIKIEKKKAGKVQYRYILKTNEGEIIPEWGDDRVLDLDRYDAKEVLVVDTWNHAGEFENAFFTAPFTETLLKKKREKPAKKKTPDHTHVFRVKAPLLNKDEMVCILGNCKTLGSWSEKDFLQLDLDGNWWTAYVDLSDENFPVAYKYGIYNAKEEKFMRYETGDNRLLYGDVAKKKVTVVHDGFARFPNNTWKGAGVSIPVFSLRSKKSFGIGEFNDLKLLVDWASGCGLKLIQILPVNDTTATHTWTDSYPYAAISAFALNPAYIHLEKVAGKKHLDKLKALSKKQKQLNSLTDVDFEAVMKCKCDVLKELYEATGKETLEEEEFRSFFKENNHWLVPYAAFCYLRDKHGDSHFGNWESHSVYEKKEIEKLTSPSSKTFEEVAFHYFVQYHLHLQLKEAADYAHKKGVILKGDIPIGIYRYGCDAWTAPDLYNMCMQAGAPPDDFAVKGQNWGFPTYNWKKMQQDHFDWWRKRFEQMSYYFDAFRIDHILGFFRIWSIPMHAVEGIMGHFTPAIPVSITEFGERGIWFDHYRYCKPHITEEILSKIFGKGKAGRFVVANDHGSYDLRPEFATQRQVEEYFNELEQTQENELLKEGLFDLISNVILFEDEKSQGEKFHFRIAMDQTSSFNDLEWSIQQKLKELYVHYFFRRQDHYWMKEAMHKLPYLKRATNMLVCGEDLGMVPHCVPDVMKQLGILSLEIQRMPKAAGKEFFHPNEAPYLSVVTPSTHDMSTIRGWWEEDREKIKRFFTDELGQWSEAPQFCEPWINRAIVMQHLYSPAMWSIFQLQDLLGMNETLRRDKPDEERINVPANPKHYWRYRMHINIEDLLKEKGFNDELHQYIKHSGR